MVDCESTRDFIDKDYAIRQDLTFTKLGREGNGEDLLQVGLIGRTRLTVGYEIAKCPTMYQGNFSEH